MNNRLYRWLTTLLACLLLAGTVSFAGAPHASYAQGGSRTFPETGHTVKGKFLTYWDTHGGLAQQGYPISEELQEMSDTDGKIYTMQYFERAVFELHPEFAGTPNEVLLSLLGVFFYNAKYGGNAANQQASTNNPRQFTETGKTIGGAFRKYWETHGGLAQQGYPISNEFQEVSSTDGKSYTVQYFQRAVFELHPEFAGTPNEVLLSLLGVFFYNQKHGSTPPGQPTATSAPAGPNPTATPTTAPAPNNDGQILFYNDTNGKLSVGKMSSVGEYSDLKSRDGASTGWTNIVALGGGRVLWYRSANGSTVIGRVDTDGTYTDTASPNTLGVGWTHIVSAGNGFILYYKKGTGTGGTARVNADGSISLLKVYTTFSPDWTHIVGLDNGVLVFYMRGTANAATLRIDNDGNLINLKSYNNWTTSWTNLVPGIGGTLLQYYYINGQAVVSRFDENGVETVLMRYPSASGDPPLPVAFPVVAGTNQGTFLMYSDSDGSGASGRIGGDGAVTIYNRYGAGSFGAWTHIVGIK